MARDVRTVRRGEERRRDGSFVDGWAREQSFQRWLTWITSLTTTRSIIVDNKKHRNTYSDQTKKEAKL
jgi:hypothetical protein